MFEDYVGKTIRAIESRGNGLYIEFEGKSKMTLYPLGTIKTEEGEDLSGLAIYMMDEKGNTDMMHTARKIQKDIEDA